MRGGVLDVFPGTARRPVRLEYWGDEIESLREFVAVVPAVVGPVVRVQVPPVRELVVDDALAARARERAPRYLDRFRDGLERIGEGLHAEGAESFAPLLFDRLETPAELLPEGSWIVLSDARRTLDRARRRSRTPRRSRPRRAGPVRRRSARSRRPWATASGCELTRVHRGHGPRVRRAGGARGATRPSSRSARPELAERGYRIVLSARGHGSLERVREVVPVRGAEAGRDAARRRVRVPGRQARRRDRGGPVRLPASHAGGAEVHDAPDRRRRRGARPPATSRSTASTGSRRYVGMHAARDRRFRARLHGARVRAGRPAVGADRPGRHGRAVRRRRDAPPVAPGVERLGADDRAASSARSRTWPASSCGCTRSGMSVERPAVRPRHALADGARGRVPARGDRRSAHGDRRGQGRPAAAAARWTG